MYIFKIPKMSCGGCVSTITSAIKNADQNATVEADVATKVVKVDSSLTEVELTNALSNIGYPAITE
jgi:copper chaperone